MKVVFLIAALSLHAVFASALSSQSNDLPQLHLITPYVFTAPYSCNGNYSTSALFLTQQSRTMNSPELLYNGACRSELYFQNSVAGTQMSVISVLGDYPLEQISASVALNIRYLHPELQAQPFFTSIPAKAHQTYSALLARDDLRVLMAFRVIDVVQDGPCKIEYVVLEYQRMQVTSQSSGWSWDGTNHR